MAAFKSQGGINAVSSALAGRVGTQQKPNRMSRLADMARRDELRKIRSGGGSMLGGGNLLGTSDTRPAMLG